MDPIKYSYTKRKEAQHQQGVHVSMEGDPVDGLFLKGES